MMDANSVQEGAVSEALVTPGELQESLYRPYKLWIFGDHCQHRVLLVKREDAPCIAACPDLNIRVEDDDYLTASGDLQQKMKACLGIPAQQVVTCTCVAPFNASEATVNDLAVSNTPHPRDTAPAQEETQISDEVGSSNQGAEAQFSLF
jgi:hypothetical protein